VISAAQCSRLELLTQPQTSTGEIEVRQEMRRRMTHPACPICASLDVSLRHSLRDRRRGLQGEWRFWLCTRCSVLFQHPIPTFVELQQYYADYSSCGELASEPSLGSRRDLLRRVYHHVTGDVDPREVINASSGLRMLDYGCGPGPYLSYFRSRGVRISGAEIEPAIVATCRAAGFDTALIDSPERIPFPDGEFDVVYLMQVIEHLPLPHQFFQELHRILRPSGEVYLAMPNGRSTWRAVFGEHWVAGWFAPFHLFVYSLPSIQTLAKAHRFEVTRAWSSTPESWLRLNLKAWLRPDNNRLDTSETTWLDLFPVRILLSVMLRLAELGLQERDCLVVNLRKC